MTPKVHQEIDFPYLELKSSSTDDYCVRLRQIKGLGFWWYQDPSNRNHLFSRPFKSYDGVWWYQVKPGLAWPVNILTPLKNPQIHFCRRYLGSQFIADADGASNSFLAFNVIQDIKRYSSATIENKRRAVRKGLNLCNIQILKKCESHTLQGCLAAWNSLVHRTGWKQILTYEIFCETWRKLLDLPGCSIVVAYEKSSGIVAGFLISKIIGDTAYIDTIASNAQLMHLHVNDALIYSFLMNSKRISNVKKAHYSLVSTVSALEKFKRSMGFQPIKYPARTALTPGVGFLLKIMFPNKYKRLVGNIQVNLI